MLDHFPEKSADVAAAAAWWPLGPRLTYLHQLVWVGPSGTVSGLHYDIPNKRAPAPPRIIPPRTDRPQMHLTRRAEPSHREHTLSGAFLGAAGSRRYGG